MKIVTKSYIAAIMALLAPEVSANPVEILGITNDGQHAQIKARLDLPQGRSVNGVKTYSYNMTDGKAITYTSYDIVDDGTDKFLSADVFYYPDKDGYTYRIELTFDDNTRYQSEVVNENLTEAFMWLGDYPMAAYKSGWDDAHPPVVDKEIDPSLKLTLDGIVYYKGISGHAPGYVEYSFPQAGFTRFVTRYGVQDDCADGDVRFIFKTNGNEVFRKDMYSKTNGARNGRNCAEDLELDMNGVTALRVEGEQIDNNWGDHMQLAMARLYLPANQTADKQLQTVKFSTQSSEIPTDGIQLNASATSGGKIFYRIISGHDLATIDGNILKPAWGGKGTVVVEATQYGNDVYFPATAYQTFNVNQQPLIELLGLYRPSIAGNRPYAYLFVDTKGKSLDKLTVDVFDNALSLNKTKTIDLTPQLTTSAAPQILPFEVGDDTDAVLKVTYSYADSSAEISMPYWHSEGYYDYMSDMPVNISSGWNQAGTGINAPYDGVKTYSPYCLALGSDNDYQTYAKGFGFHANGWAESTADLSPYYRIATEIGPQYYSIRNSRNGKMGFYLQNGNTELVRTDNLPRETRLVWDYPINGQQKLRLGFTDGGDGNSNDVGAICAPRLYYSPKLKSAQSISWEKERRIVSNSAQSIKLDAVASTGLPVTYYLAKGAEVAEIKGSTLIISELVSGTEIVVDAVQPGDYAWDMAPVASCTFSLVRGLDVKRDEYVEISGPDTLDELIVHADKDASGQVTVKDGLVNVKTLFIKYTFVPGDWNYISFPSDLDIDKISDFREKGYTYNAYGAPAYFIKEYATRDRADAPDGESWKLLDRPFVKGLKGYIMGIDESASEPVEITFRIDNVELELGTIARALSLSLDLSGFEPDSDHEITIAPANVAGDNLTLTVHYAPDKTSLPVNHAKALEAMRHTFVGDKKALRLTLPDQTPARVVFFDEKGKKIVKAVRYISPMAIDITDLKPGIYNVAVGYGNANRVIQIEL